MPFLKGDFEIPERDFERAQDIHESRPAINRRRDEQRRARVTDDFALWSSDKDSYDFPGVDTPKNSPEVKQKDRPFLNQTDDGLGSIILDSKL